ncbi:hypothetical protein [Pelagibius sp.]|uniref:hypothetical protein n=1 Tax=Pelagibius sp. TaxID=1931238 RepID=UPI003BB21A94
MRDLFASFTAGTPRTAGVTVTETTGRLIDPAPEIARLAAGQYLRGQVIGQDEAGLLILQIRLAVVKLAAARNLAVGSEVVLQIRSGGPQPTVALLPVDGPALPAPAGGDPLPTRGLGALTPTAPGAQPVAPPDPISRAAFIRAILQSAPPLPLLAGLPSAEPGTELLLRILSIGAPGPQNQGTAALPSGQAGPAIPGPGGAAAPAIGAGTAGGSGITAGPGQGTPGSTPGALPGAGTPPTSGAATPPTQGPASNGAATQTPAGSGAAVTTGLPPQGPSGTAPDAGLRLAPQTTVINAGRSVAAALQGVTAEGASRAAGTTAGSAAADGPEAMLGDGKALRLTGLVTARSGSGPAILHTAMGAITLKAPVDLPTGASLALEVLVPGSGKTALPPISFATPWPSADAVEEALLGGLPSAQAEVLQRALPQVGPRLSSGILFFLSAINQGSPLAWLAGPAAALERGERGEFLDRLGRELAGLSRSVETASGEWRLLQLPVWSDEGLRELRLFLRQQAGGGGQQDDEAGDKATRFVLELELKHHGELQLDGLVRAQQFDLILRSRRRLSAVMRGDLLALFEEANAIAGYRGRLVFQASPDWTQLLAAQAAKTENATLQI